VPWVQRQDRVVLTWDWKAFSKFSHNRTFRLHRAFATTLHSIFSPDSAVQAQFIWSVSVLSPSTFMQLPAYHSISSRPPTPHHLRFFEASDSTTAYCLVLQLFAILRSSWSYHCLRFCELSSLTTLYHSTNSPHLQLFMIMRTDSITKYLLCRSPETHGDSSSIALSLATSLHTPYTEDSSFLVFFSIE